MAQSIGNLFSATLGATELESDNEHTLITTGSGETKVVKDVFLDNSNNVPLSNGAGTYLELNGHKIQEVDGSGLSGELIVPPNSTLKLKNHSYPVYYQYQRTWFLGDQNQRLYLKRTINNLDTGEELATVSEMKSYSAGPNNWSEIREVQSLYAWLDTNNTVNHLFYNTHDNNSVQQLQACGINGRNTTSFTGLLYENYKGFGFSPDRWSSSTNMYDNQWFKLENGYWYQRQMYGGSGANSAGIGIQITNPAFTNRTALSYIQQMPTSSYPRGLYIIRDPDSTNGVGMWMFWIPADNYTTDIYAFSTDIRQNFRFTMPNTWQNSGNYDFCASVDVINDRLIFWRPYNANTVYRHECKTPWSTLTSSTQPTSTTSPIHYQATSFTSDSVPLPTAICTQSFGSCQFSNRMDGGFAFKGSDGKQYHLDGDGKQKYVKTSFLSDDDGALTTANNGGCWAFRSQVAPNYLLSRYGVSSPTFTLSLNGYSIS